MTLAGTESGVEALSDCDIHLYGPYTIRAWATSVPPTAYVNLVLFTYSQRSWSCGLRCCRVRLGLGARA